MASLKTASLALFVAGASADVYMHNPPGNNDRNRERNDNRNNANRLFDSQNNGAGGYPWRGDPTADAMADSISYLSGSELEIKWTDQHGCGDNPSTHCTVLLQYACENTMPGLRDGYPTGGLENQPDGGDYNPPYQQRNFQNGDQNDDGTNTIPNEEVGAGCTPKTAGDFSQVGIFADDNHGSCSPCELAQLPQGSLSTEQEELAEACEFGMNEDYYWYNIDCTRRERNMGLYIADRDLNGDTAEHTRQNPNGNRRGLECPEERDYYPYWHPTQWIDMAVLVSDESWCPYYQQESQNIKDRYYCYMDDAINNNGNNNPIPITEQGCNSASGTWTKVDSYQNMFPDMNIVEPDCKVASFTEQNHLGFTRDVADYSSYTWTIPDTLQSMECVVRIRYNISTADYGSMDGFEIDEDGVLTNDVFGSENNCPDDSQVSSNDGDENDASQTVPGAVSGGNNCYGDLIDGAVPLYNRPYVQMFENTAESDLAIALNTDQSGRTFQDRSFVFNIAPRPDDVPDDAVIYNLNVMGKRGNIVQSYPAIEYAFVPFSLEPAQYDYVHIQFHGSDFNAEKNPNNGEGWKFSDRSNMVQVSSENTQFPMHESEADFFSHESLNWVSEMALLGQEARLNTHSEGPFTCVKAEDFGDDDDEYQNSPLACNKLNSAPNTFQPGNDMGLMQVRADVGTYSFVSTRNNNFSNRSQKMSISVGYGMALSAGQVAGAVIGTIVGVGAAVLIVLVCLALFGIVKASWLPKQKFNKDGSKVSSAKGGDAGPSKYQTAAAKTPPASGTTRV